MPEVKLGWVDRLLIKVALAKRLARNPPYVTADTAQHLADAFRRVNENEASRTSQSSNPEGLK
jgi:hypothetical protein